MPRATHEDTTPGLRPPHGADAIDGDTLILALAAQYRELTAAIDAFDTEAGAWTGSMQTYLRSRYMLISDRRDSVHNAMCSIKASGLPGAMVQVELLYLMVDDTGEIDDQYRRRHTQSMRECLVCSIFNVLARETGRTAADGINVMLPWRDEMRLDMPALMDEWRRMLQGGGGSAGERKSPLMRAAA